MPYYPPRPDEKPRDGDPRDKNPGVLDPGTRRKLLRWASLGLSVLLIGYGGVRLGIYIHDYFSARKTSQELRETVEAMEETENTASSENAAARAGEEIQPAEAAFPGTEDAGPGREETDPSGKGAPPETAAEPAPAAETEGSAPAASGLLPPVEYPGGMEVVPKIRELRKKSDYILGWIAMEGVEEPVAFKDNAFFLNHDAMGKRNGNGAIFMDEKTRLLTRPYTVFLYGHNMKTGAMFGGLRKYEDFSYFFHHRLFQFDTLYEEGQYVIFAVETIQLTPGLSRYFNIYELASDDRGTRRSALETLKRLSMHEVMLDVNEEDQLVLLVTCVGDDDERLVVATRRMREGEQPDRLSIRNP